MTDCNDNFDDDSNSSENTQTSEKSVITSEKREITSENSEITYEKYEYLNKFHFIKQNKIDVPYFNSDSDLEDMKLVYQNLLNEINKKNELKKIQMELDIIINIKKYLSTSTITMSELKEMITKVREKEFTDDILVFINLFPDGLYFFEKLITLLYLCGLMSKIKKHAWVLRLQRNLKKSTQTNIVYI